MSIFSLGLLGVLVAGIASMTAAVERGDPDEAARQGVLAGPAVVEQALESPRRDTRLAGIAAAPAVEDRAELLPDLAAVARGGDRRTAIPAVHAALGIAKELAARDGLPDDLAAADVEEWRAMFERLGRDRERFVEVRVSALRVATELAHVNDRSAAGFDVAAIAADPDPDVRAAAN
jgi:hypothetical protein